MSTYAVSTWLVGHLPPEEAVRTLADTGFTQAELSANWSPLVSAWEEDPVGVFALLSQAGISVPSIHNTREARHLDAPDDSERRASVQDNIRYFPMMAASGIPEIVVHPVSGVAGDDDEAWAAATRRSRESLEILAEEAGEAGVRLAVENVGRGGRPGSTMTSILELIDGLGDHVGLCMDIGHSQQAHLDLLDELSVALSSGRLFTLHLHDVDAEGTDHYIPGEGCIDFAPYLAMLDEHGFEGGRTLEIRVAPPEEAAERAAQTAAVRDEWERR